MPYVECAGDWCRRQPATIEEAEMFVFPVAVQDPSRLDDLCEKIVDTPSNGVVRAKPWKPVPNVDPIVLLTAARFSKIRSGDANESLYGYIDELDVGFFVLVEVEVNGQPRGLFALNPFIYVDNPAGVIMGREIFGFPKIEGAIGWNPSTLEFDLHSLVFTANTASTGATREKLLELKRSPFLSFFAPLFGSSGADPMGQADDDDTIANVTAALGQQLLDWIGGGGVPVSGFAKVRLPLLKQYRAVTPGTGTAYQQVVQATFDIESISAFTVYPRFLFWLSPLTLHLEAYPSIDIADALGLARTTKIRRGFRVVCKLELEGSTF